MSKPNTEKCNRCYVVNNHLRCSLCKWAPVGFLWDIGSPFAGLEDHFIEKETSYEKRQLDVLEGPDE